jgi:hypothetical protein
MFGAVAATTLGDHTQQGADDQWATAPEPVGERAEHQLSKGQPEQKRRQGQLYGGGAARQLRGHLRERRQVEVGGHRRDRIQQGQHQQQPW